MSQLRRLSTLDVFAILDSDSAEAKGFTTYLGYWDGFARLITEQYGSDPSSGLVAELRSRSAVQKLISKPFSGDGKELRAILLNAWAQELGLYSVDADDPRLMLHNLWNNVQAYYASSGIARGFLLVRGTPPPRTHAKTLKSVTSLVKDTSLLPSPWGLCCTAEKPLTFHGFAGIPDDCSNLAVGAKPEDVVAKALKTTRRRDLDLLVDKYRADHKVTKVPNGTRAGFDKNSTPTTTFDFMWRNRTRSNYGDPSMFYVGALSQERSKQYVESIQLVTSATMLTFETMMAQRVSKILEDAAVHFISRDRSTISDDVIGGRLRAMGLLT